MVCNKMRRESANEQIESPYLIPSPLHSAVNGEMTKSLDQFGRDLAAGKQLCLLVEECNFL